MTTRACGKENEHTRELIRAGRKETGLTHSLQTGIRRYRPLTVFAIHTDGPLGTRDSTPRAAISADHGSDCRLVRSVREMDRST